MPVCTLIYQVSWFCDIFYNLAKFLQRNLEEHLSSHKFFIVCSLFLRSWLFQNVQFLPPCLFHFNIQVTSFDCFSGNINLVPIWRKYLSRNYVIKFPLETMLGLTHSLICNETFANAERGRAIDFHGVIYFGYMRVAIVFCPYVDTQTAVRL